MKKFFQKQRETMAIFVYFVAIMAVVCFVSMPLLGGINKVRDQIQEEILKQEIIRQQLGELPKIQEQYEMLIKKESVVDVLFDKNNAVTLIEKLEGLAQSGNNKIEISVQDKPKSTQENKSSQSLSKKKDTEKELVEYLPSQDYLQMKITITGSYNSIVDFIKKLESFEYYCDITSIQIKQAESDNKQVADIGVANPFDSNHAMENQEVVENIEDKKITADFDVVFYTKK